MNKRRHEVETCETTSQSPFVRMGKLLCIDYSVQPSDIIGLHGGSRPSCRVEYRLEGLRGQVQTHLEVRLQVDREGLGHPSSLFFRGVPSHTIRLCAVRDMNIHPVPCGDHHPTTKRHANGQWPLPAKEFNFFSNGCNQFLRQTTA